MKPFSWPSLASVALLLPLVLPLASRLQADPPPANAALIGNWQETKELKNYPGSYAGVIFDASGRFTYNGPGAYSACYSISGKYIVLTDCDGDGSEMQKIRLVAVDGAKLILQWDPNGPLTNYKRRAGGEDNTPPPPPSSAGYAPGSRVEVQWQGQWYPATILKVDGQKYLIHYEGYESSWDEWVTAERIKP